jgi:glucose/arabinose dehydrogenase
VRSSTRWLLVLAFPLGLACGDNRRAVDAPSGADARTACTPVRGTNVGLRWIVHGCDVPGAPPRPDCIEDVLTLVTSPPADRRLFAVELAGRIRIVEDGALLPEPFVDLSDDVGGPVIADNELGLLGLAFPPDFAASGEFYVYYTQENPDVLDVEHPFLDVLARFSILPTDPDRADASSGVVVLSILDRYGNHNGGMIEFGPDGYLYVSTGDGGAGGDPFDNAQNPDVLLGKMLRLDVARRSGTAEYGIPPDNPFALGGGAPEVYMLGLRNAWRFTFDRVTGDLWIADVGQADIEEIHVLPPARQAGANLGWDMYEGNNCFEPPCDPTGMTFPQVTHTHAEGFWAIIGGEVYRGGCFPDLVGRYFYTDCFYGHMQSAILRGDGTVESAQLPGDFIGGPTSVHSDAFGELYETDILGNIFQIVATP